MAKFLLVFCPQQQGVEVEQIKKQLRRFGTPAVQQETNCETGLEQVLQQGFDFVIVGSSLAADAGAVVEPGGGLDFCRKARALSVPTPMMLLAPALTSELLRETAKIAGVTAYADPGTAGGFALELLQVGQRVEPCLAIRVTASEGGWRFDIDGVGFKFHGEGALSIQRSAWHGWEAQRMYQPDWYTEFSRIGESIRMALCDENPHFRVQRELGRAEAVQQLGENGKLVSDRITFVVAEAFYPLMLEAVFDPSQRPEPWLAQASSVARRLIASGASTSDDLFTGSPAARRALLICADTRGDAFSTKLLGGQVKLDPLRSVRLECKRVRKLLTKKDPRSGQPLFYEDNVKVLGLDGPVTRADLNAALREGIWDLIHFAGHTCFQRHGAQQAGGTGFLFIGPPDEPECIDFGEVSGFMGKARFVYLSSCESGNSGFATLAAAAGIHAVLGYRCRVNDRTAAIQALLFYRLLLRSHSLGSAFGLARRRIYRRYGDSDNAWASAMLVTPEFRT